jgi:hypothetical protein
MLWNVGSFFAGLMGGALSLVFFFILVGTLATVVLPGKTFLPSWLIVVLSTAPFLLLIAFSVFIWKRTKWFFFGLAGSIVYILFRIIFEYMQVR